MASFFKQNKRILGLGFLLFLLLVVKKQVDAQGNQKIINDLGEQNVNITIGN